MEQADQVEFVKVLNGLAAMKPGAKLTRESIALYWESMRSKWTLADFKAAAAHLAEQFEFMPNPFHFEQLRKAGEPTADEAWNLVISGARLPPGSRVWRTAETLGGQFAIRHEDVEKTLPFTRIKFLKAYDELTHVDPVREALPQIAAQGARAALTAPTSIADFVPNALLELKQSGERINAIRQEVLTDLSKKTAPASAAPPPKSARDKILALLPLPGMDDAAVAKVSGESIDVVRQVRAEQGCAA